MTDITSSVGSPATDTPVTARRRLWLHAMWSAARTRRGAVGLALTAVITLTAFVGPLFAPRSPTAFAVAPFAAPSSHALLGGDQLGRDVLSRVLDGGRALLIMAAAATFVGVAIGGTLGITAAYLRGKSDTMIMRSVDVVLAFPQVVFGLLLVSIIGPKLWLIVLAVGITHIPQVARVLRSSVLDISERDFIKAVELNGVPSSRIMFAEILPNLASPLMVEIGLRLTYSIIIIAGLSFLGFGQQPPSASWGLMINENRIGLAANPWATVVPALLIAVLTVGMNTFTDAVARAVIGVDRHEAAPVAVEMLELSG